MKKYKLETKFGIWALLLVCCLAFLSFIGSTNFPILSKNLCSDTTAFIADTAAGWRVYTSYLDNIGDSVEFEFILLRDTPIGTNWNDSSFVGTIINGYPPTSERIINYVQLPQTWKIVVEPDGRCFFTLLTGPAPIGNPVWLPLITKYKK